MFLQVCVLKWLDQFNVPLVVVLLVVEHGLSGILESWVVDLGVPGCLPLVHHELIRPCLRLESLAVDSILLRRWKLRLLLDCILEHLNLAVIRLSPWIVCSARVRVPALTRVSEVELADRMVIGVLSLLDLLLHGA
jgi:hypothetical protein